ncbi:MAG TPA: hypothetical protein VG797_08535 [Phycisphaerales bacterium]|nr:hypothetical protein [Phycisphaerales bacterium]
MKKQLVFDAGRALLVSCIALAPACPAAAQTTTRVSLANDGAQGNDGSGVPAISTDGRFVAFYSNASNLVAGDTNSASDIFVRDRQTGETSRVSVDSNGGQGNGNCIYLTMSADSRFVAFESDATNLVQNDTNGRTDIFVHDRQTGQTSRVSVATDGTQGEFASGSPSISADGRFVTFYSGAANLVPGDTNDNLDVYVHDRQTGRTSRVSVDSSGGEANGGSYYQTISADGRFVAFDSTASNLAPDDTNGAIDAFVHDRQTGLTTRISAAPGGTPADGHSWSPSISADGRCVAFHSLATNLVPGDTNGGADVFVQDLQSGQITRVSVASDGTQGNNDDFFLSQDRPAISADGRIVVFSSEASNLVPGDTNLTWDVFVHDRVTHRTSRVNVDNTGGEANDFSQIALPSAISADGRFVAFDTFASNLVPDDTNAHWDAFVHDRGPITPACPGDVDGNQAVGLSDIAVLIQHWTLAVPPAPAAADLDGNGSIGLGDVAVAILHWAEVCR